MNSCLNKYVSFHKGQKCMFCDKDGKRCFDNCDEHVFTNRQQAISNILKQSKLKKKSNIFKKIFEILPIFIWILFIIFVLHMALSKNNRLWYEKGYIDALKTITKITK